MEIPDRAIFFSFLFSVAHSDSGLSLNELCEPLAYYTEHNKMKDLSNKNVSLVPRTNSSDLHHFQTPSAELRTQKLVLASIPFSLPLVLCNRSDACVEHGRSSTPCACSHGRILWGSESIKLRLLFLTGVLDVLMYMVLFLESRPATTSMMRISLSAGYGRE